VIAAVPDIASVRAFLEPRCEDAAALAALEVSHVNPAADGSLKLLLEGPRPGGGTLRLTARRLAPAKARRFEDELNRRGRERGPGPATGFADAAMYAPELGLLFQVFPADRRLPSLPTVIDGRAMAPILEGSLALRAGGERVRAVRARAVRYKPERKCLVRYDIRWAGGAEDLPAVVYGRVASRRKFERARGVPTQLRAAGGGAAFALPEELGVRDDLCLQLLSHVPGRPLSALAETPAFPGLCARAGASLSVLHALPALLAERAGPAARVAHVTRVAGEFAALLPRRRERIAAAGRAVGELVRALPPVPARVVHGDFHGDNVLVGGTSLGLIDLEDCAMGDPASDVAQYLVELERRSRTSAVAQAGRRAFSQAYLDAAGERIGARLPAHIAAHRFLAAYQCLRRPLDPAPEEDAEALLEACEDALCGGPV
jgi:hypothetical protein